MVIYKLDCFAAYSVNKNIDINMNCDILCKWCGIGFTSEVSRIGHQLLCARNSSKFAKRDINVIVPRLKLDVSDLCLQLRSLENLRSVAKVDVGEQCTNDSHQLRCDICGALLVQYFGCGNFSCNLK